MAGKKIQANCNAITFKIDNVGLVDRHLRVDVGFKDEISGPYIVLIENAIEILIPPDNLPGYKENSAIIVPTATIELIENYGL